jgi:hypothetical protein
MPEQRAIATEGPPLPELQPEEDVWALLALPSITLVATDRRLLSRSGDRTDAWRYEEISQVGQAGVDGDVVISFDNGQRPLVVHANGNEPAMQALTVIGLLVAQSRRVERQHPRLAGPAARRG